MPKLKMKKFSKRERKEKEQEVETEKTESSEETSREKSDQDKPEKKVRRSKKEKEPEESHMPVEEMYIDFDKMLKEIGKEMQIQKEAQQAMSEFHRRVGNTFSSDMSGKERKEAQEIYAKLQADLKASGESLLLMTNKLKSYRELEVERARNRGELNAIQLLASRHGCLPLLDITNIPEPYGAGALQWPENKRLVRKEEVAAFVESTKTWIVAEVAGSVSNHRYECVDIDDRDRKKTVFARKQLIPLPQFTVDYARWPFMAFQENAHVLALFPGTTCLYEAKVVRPPNDDEKFYIIKFVDHTNATKFGPEVEVSERYIVPYRKDPKIYIRPEKRIALGLEAPKDETMLSIGDEPKERKKKGRKKKVVEAVNIEEIVDEKDVPGPAPKARPQYYESPDEDEDSKRKRKRKVGKKATKVAKVEKVKVLRARVPEHKKKRSTRQFGKRKVKRKKPMALNAGEAPKPTEEECAATHEAQSEDALDDYIPRNDELDASEADLSKESLELTEKIAEDPIEKETDDEGDPETEDEEEEEEEEETSSDEDSDDDEDVSEKSHTVREPHDPQEGCSSSYQSHLRVESESDESENESSDSRSSNSSSSSDSDSSDDDSEPEIQRHLPEDETEC